MTTSKALSALEKGLREFALAFPETDEAFPWGERSLRVRGKAFVFMRLEKDELSFSVKLPKSRRQALALPFVAPTHYGLGKHGWVTVRVNKSDRNLESQFRDWIAESFSAVAPKRLVQPAPTASVKAPARKRSRPASAKRARSR